MQLDFAAKTDVGTVRKENQDSYGILESSRFFIVCDGMGGGAAGDFASRCAVDVMLKAFNLLKTKDILSLLGNNTGGLPEHAAKPLACIKLANRALYNYADAYPNLSGMGTTAAAAFFEEEKGVLHIYHAGDSRVYRQRGGRLEQLTRDHSKVAELIEQGKMREDEVKTAEIQSMITRALGIRGTLSVDYRAVSVLPGDHFVLCSDGLNSELEDAEIRKIITNNDGNVDQICKKLIYAANTAGGKDNDTVIALYARGGGYIPERGLDGAAVTVPEETPGESSHEDHVLKAVISAAKIKVPESAKEKGLFGHPFVMGVLLAGLVAGAALFLARSPVSRPEKELTDLTGKETGIAVTVRRPSDEQLTRFRRAEDRIQQLEILQEWYAGKDDMTSPVKDVEIIVHQDGRESSSALSADAPVPITLRSGGYTILLRCPGHAIITEKLVRNGAVTGSVEKGAVFKPVTIIMIPEE